jgi:hypothetical protein
MPGSAGAAFNRVDANYALDYAALIRRRSRHFRRRASRSTTRACRKRRRHDADDVQCAAVATSAQTVTVDIRHREGAP